MSVAAPAADAQAELLALLDAAVSAHANVVQVRVDKDAAVIEIMAAGSPVDVREVPLSRCADLLPALFSLCDEADDYVYGSSRSARMTGVKMALPAGVSMVFVQFFPARDGQRHMVARLTYDGDVCCGSCGG